MRLDGSLDDSEFVRDLPVGAAGDQQPRTSRSRSLILSSLAVATLRRRDGRAFDELGQYSSRYPHGAGMNFADGFLEFLCRRFLGKLTFCAGRYGAQDVVITIAGAGHDDADLRDEPP